jgi:DNA-binding response OmpR family regulator
MTWPQYRRRECTVCGFLVRLSALEVEALLVLLLRYPCAVSTADLIEAVHPDPDREPELAEDSIFQTIHRLRAKIGGFHIHRRNGFGYELVQAPG